MILLHSYYKIDFDWTMQQNLLLLNNAHLAEYKQSTESRLVN